jgi:hypothetical protein
LLFRNFSKQPPKFITAIAEQIKIDLTPTVSVRLNQTQPPWPIGEQTGTEINAGFTSAFERKAEHRNLSRASLLPAQRRNKQPLNLNDSFRPFAEIAMSLFLDISYTIER